MSLLHAYGMRERVLVWQPAPALHHQPGHVLPRSAYACMLRLPPQQQRLQLPLLALLVLTALTALLAQMALMALMGTLASERCQQPSRRRSIQEPR